jgi:MFS family permease
VPLGLLVKDAATTKISAAMLILCSVQNFGYYGLMIWLPSYLSTRFGYTLTQSAVWTAVTVLGMAFGIWIFGQFADRIGRRPALLAFQSGAFVMVLVYSQLTDPTALLIGGAVMGMFVNGMLGGYGALLSEFYPTEARATAENVLFNLGRGVGGFGPYVVGALAATYSFTVAIALLATIYLVDIVTTVFLIPERKGVPLE